MPDNKNQHFVPQFYLKLFSKDKKSINLFNFQNNKVVENASIRGQCSKDYFYGKDQFIDNYLHKIETNASLVIQSIIKNKELPQKDTFEDFHVLYFIIMQLQRTLYEAEATDEFVDKFLKNSLLKHNFPNQDIDDLKISIPDVQVLNLLAAKTMFLLTLDLKCKLIINNSGIDFITSDNPVIKFNHLFEYRKFGTSTGIAFKGLEILFPLSSKVMIIYYDDYIYRVGNNKNRIIYSNSDDVKQLNIMQFLNCLSNIYWEKNIPLVSTKFRDYLIFRRKFKSDTISTITKKNETEMSELVAGWTEDIKFPLSLSFIKIKKKEKKWLNKLKIQKLQPTVILRNDAYYDSITKGEKRQLKNIAELFPFKVVKTI